MMDAALRTLLQEDLECSEGFLQWAEERHITSIIALMDNILDTDNDGEPDMCNLLHLFHDESDLMDVSAQEHEFKDEIVNLFHFAFKMKKAWNNQTAPGSFNHVDHFHNEPFCSTMRKTHNKLNTTFKHGLIAFTKEPETLKKEDEELSAAAHAVTKKMDQMSHQA